MQMLKVESSVIAEVGYDEPYLRIKFKSGQTYDYVGVSQEQFKELIKAPSKGKYFRENILDKFPGARMTKYL